MTDYKLFPLKLPVALWQTLRLQATRRQLSLQKLLLEAAEQAAKEKTK